MSKRSSEGLMISRSVSAPMSMKRPKQFAKGKIRSKIPKGLKSYINKTVQSLAEKKLNVAAAIITLTTAITTTPVGLNLVPRVDQGAAQNQRIGNDIRVKTAVIRGNITCNPYNATKNPVVGPIIVKLWLCRYKSANTSSLLQTNIDTSFFETGSGAQGFTGNITDLTLFPNNDSWEILESKEYKLGAGSVSATFTAATYAFDNSPVTAHFQMDVAKYLRGVTSYLDNSSTVATNKNLFLVFQPVYAWPYAATAASELAQCSYAYRCEYTDS